MKATNLPNGAQRGVEVGFVWEEVITAGDGTFEVQPQGTIRVQTAALTTITIAGVLAMTLPPNNIEILNVGTGASDDGKTTVTVVIVGTANVQRAVENDRGRRSK